MHWHKVWMMNMKNRYPQDFKIKEIYKVFNINRIRIETYVKKNWANIYFEQDIDRKYLDQILAYEELVEPDDAPDSLAGGIRELTTKKKPKKSRMV